MTALKIISLGLLPCFLISCSNHALDLKRDPGEKVLYFLNNMIENSDTPGVQYLISNRDSTLFEFNGGVSKIANKTLVSPLTTFNAFSVTKTFTALAIMQLEEAGKLKIDDTVQTYLHDLPYKTRFTIHQLLSHTSGLPNPMPLRWVHLIEEHDSFEYEAFIKSVVKENDELDDQPGEKYAYSNIGYLLLGKIITQVSGEDYRSYINKNIIQKLTLSSHAYLGFVIPDTMIHAHGYIKKWSFLNFGLNFLFDKSKFMDETYDGWTQFRYFYINGYAFGGLIGNARGFSGYLRALLQNNTFISDSSKLKLFKTQKLSDGEPIEMCLGWFEGKLGDKIYYAHAGGGGGYYCEIRIYPDANISSVIIFNRTGVSDDRILDKLDHFFWEK